MLPPTAASEAWTKIVLSTWATAIRERLRRDAVQRPHDQTFKSATPQTAQQTERDAPGREWADAAEVDDADTGIAKRVGMAGHAVLHVRFPNDPPGPTSSTRY
jgi:hypothetical protein